MEITHTHTRNIKYINKYIFVYSYMSMEKVERLLASGYLWEGVWGES